MPAGAAIGAMRNRKLDDVADQLGPVFRLPSGQRLAPLTRRLGDISRALATGEYRSDPSAATLADEIRQYCDAGADRLALPAGEETG